MAPIQKQIAQTFSFVLIYATSVGFLGVRRVQYFIGVSKVKLAASALIGVAPVILGGAFAQRENADQIRRICTLAGIIIGAAPLLVNNNVMNIEKCLYAPFRVVLFQTVIAGTIEVFISLELGNRSEKTSDGPFPSDVLGEIFQYLPLKDVSSVAPTCKTWAKVIEQDHVQNALIGQVAYGKDVWACLGGVDEVPPIPKNMAQIFRERDPFDPTYLRQVKENYVLVLIPQKVNGHPLTLNLLHRSSQRATGKPQIDFLYYSQDIQAELGETSVDNSYWVLMRKHLIPIETTTTYDQRKRLIQDGKDSNYQIPKALEATAGMLMHYFKTGRVLYGDNSWVYTSSIVGDDQSSMAIMSISNRLVFSCALFTLGFYDSPSPSCGVAVARHV